MIQVPSKFLSRNFLKNLLSDNCVTDSGREYFEDEVRSLLIEKEIKENERDYSRELKRLASRPVDHSAVIMAHQERVISTVNPGSLRGLAEKCQAFSPCKYFSVNTTKDLQDFSTQDLLGSAQVTTSVGVGLAKDGPVPQKARRKKKMGAPKFYRGYPVLSVKEYSLKEIQRDIAKTKKVIAQVNALTKK